MYNGDDYSDEETGLEGKGGELKTSSQTFVVTKPTPQQDLDLGELPDQPEPEAFVEPAELNRSQTESNFWSSISLTFDSPSNSDNSSSTYSSESDTDQLNGDDESGTPPSSTFSTFRNLLSSFSSTSVPDLSRPATMPLSSAPVDMPPPNSLTRSDSSFSLFNLFSLTPNQSSPLLTPQSTEVFSSSASKSWWDLSSIFSGSPEESSSSSLDERLELELQSDPQPNFDPNDEPDWPDSYGYTPAAYKNENFTPIELATIKQTLDDIRSKEASSRMPLTDKDVSGLSTKQLEQYERRREEEALTWELKLKEKLKGKEEVLKRELLEAKKSPTPTSRSSSASLHDTRSQNPLSASILSLSHSEPNVHSSHGLTPPRSSLASALSQGSTPRSTGGSVSQHGFMGSPERGQGFVPGTSPTSAGQMPPISSVRYKVPGK